MDEYRQVFSQADKSWVPRPQKKARILSSTRADSARTSKRKLAKQSDDARPTSQQRGFSEDPNQPDAWAALTSTMRAGTTDPADGEFVDEEWDENADHSTLGHVYGDNELNLDAITAKWKEINASNPPLERRDMRLADLSPSQQKPVVIWLKIMGLWRDDNDAEGAAFLPPVTRDDCLAPNAMILAGAAGTGKSYIIDCLVFEAVQRYTSKYGMAPDGKPYTVLVLAPTGRAAIAAKGYTYQSKEGLNCPVNNPEKFAPHVSGAGALLKLRDRMKNCIGVVVDEYSMVHQVSMFWVSHRLQEAYSNELPFGGIPIAWCGDAAQIPPVGGSSPWVYSVGVGSQARPVVGLAKKGYDLWRTIKNVVILSETRRQTGPFSDFLSRLRDGNNSEEDWIYLNQNCSSVHKSAEDVATFNSPDTTWLFSKNKECHDHNSKMLKQMNVPRVRMDADHDCQHSATKTVVQCLQLAPLLVLCRGAKIMVLHNVNAKIGLVNGASGKVVDWLYKEGTVAPSPPQVLVCHIDDYCGPPFFAGVGREKWVPLLPKKHSWSSDRAGDADDHYRSQFPISLGWGLTPWKAQGMTIHTTLAFILGTLEAEAGLTYVGISRMTDILNLFIGQGCSLDRLTKTIKKNAKLKQRLLEDARQLILWGETHTFFFPS
jgi:ATP-dependent DNA helicase PIF1